ncbi:uncharacterized protein [Dermacentor albipictus]|uniref:uncharacterized protein n=1 Tax=Dermacentor albipictus TaxID=60249 RepID=UPI0038FCF9E4
MEGELVSAEVLRLNCTRGHNRLCQLLRHLTACDKVLWHVGLQLHEDTRDELGEVSVVTVPSIRRRFQSHTEQAAIALLYRLIADHRCIVSAELNYSVANTGPLDAVLASSSGQVTRVLPSLSEVMPQKKDTGFWTGTLVIQAFAKRAVFLALLPWCGPKDYPKFHAVLVLGHVLLETAVMWKAVEATGKLRPGGPGTVLVVTFWYYIIEIAFLIIHVIARDLSVPYAMSSNSWFAYTQIYSASPHSRRTWSTVSLSPHLPQVGGSLPGTVLVVTFWYYIIEIAFLIIHVIAGDLSVPYAMSSNSWFAYTQICE